MQRFKIIKPPSNREVNTAFHQDEGILVQTSEDRLFAIVPKSSITGEGGYQILSGRVTEIINSRFADTRNGRLEYPEDESKRDEGFLEIYD